MRDAGCGQPTTNALRAAFVGILLLLCCARPANADSNAPQRITALWNSPQHLDLFATDTQGDVVSTWWAVGCGWQPWFAIHPESATSAPGQPVTAVWATPQHLDAFFIGQDGRVMSTWWEAAKSWQPWFAIHPETAIGAPGQLVTAVWATPQHLDLFITGRDGRVMSTWWEAAKSWQPWFAIHPETAIGAPAQSVTAVWATPQHLDLFITGRDGRVMSTWWEAAKNWQPWFAIHPETAIGAPGQLVTAVWATPQHLDLFITGRDGRVMSTWWEAAKSWQPWFAIHPETAIGAPAQSVTAVWATPQHLDLFITGRDGRVMSTWWEAAKNWQPWFAIHPETAIGAPGQSVTAVWATPQHLDLFIAGRDGRVMSTWWEAAKSWQPWFAIFPKATALRDPRNVLTELYDTARTGASLNETLLTPAAVRSARFGKRTQWQIEGQLLAQPLYVRGVPVGSGTKNLVIAASAANLVYAFDADSSDPNAPPVFKVKLGRADELLDPTNPNNHPPFHTVVPVCDQTFPHFIGVTATPVIDDATGIMYVVNYDTTNDQHVLHALDLHRGLEDARPPVVIAARGFNPHFGRNRAALLLQNQVVYIAFGSFICDNPQPFSGWVFGYRTSDLAQVASWQVPVPGPRGGGGIWQSGRGLVGAADGSIYLETGNDASFPTLQQSLANSFVKLRTSCAGGGLAVGGSFTPTNSNVLSVGDTDLGSSGPLLLPGQRLIGGGKQGRAYVLDANTLKLSQDAMNGDGFQGFQAFVNTYHMDSNQPTCPNLSDAWCKTPTGLDPNSWKNLTPPFGSQCFIPSACYQTSQALGPNIHAGFVYWQGGTQDAGLLYALAEKEFLRAFRYHVSNGLVDETPAFTATDVRAPDGMPGGAISVSANGSRDGVLWVTMSADQMQDASDGVHPGTLVALDATNLTVLWRDNNVPAFAKFNPPTVADGKVFLPTFAQPDAQHPDGLSWLIVYGLD